MLERVFNRDRSAETTATAVVEVPEAKVGGKGHATPTRREAQARNRTPLVGAPPPPKGATRQERKEAKAARRELQREQRLKAAEGLARGDERFMPVRDRGPAKRLARDVVDVRRNLGELFLPVAAGSFVLMLLPFPAVRVAAPALLYTFVLGVFVDSVLINRRVKRLVADRFGDDETKGVGTYAAMRATQFRRARRPPPRLERGAPIPTR